jgi:hypothetical protein
MICNWIACVAARPSHIVAMVSDISKMPRYRQMFLNIKLE